jgi:hypothetical protein
MYFCIYTMWLVFLIHKKRYQFGIFFILVGILSYNISSRIILAYPIDSRSISLFTDTLSTSDSLGSLPDELREVTTNWATCTSIHLIVISRWLSIPEHHRIWSIRSQSRICCDNRIDIFPHSFARWRWWMCYSIIFHHRICPCLGLFLDLGIPDELGEIVLSSYHIVSIQDRIPLGLTDCIYIRTREENQHSDNEYFCHTRVLWGIWPISV